MFSASAILLCFACFAAALPGDDPTPQRIVEQVLKAAADLERPEPTGDQTADRAAQSRYFEQMRALQGEAARAALAQHAELLAQGDALFYRARLEMITGERDQALATLRSHLEVAKDAALCNESKLQIFAATQYTEPGAALALFEQIDAKELSEDAKKSYDQHAQRLDALRGRVALHDGPPPALPVERVLNGAADFDPLALRGKVVVVDFFATWCPPCRAVVPALVADQAEWGDQVQVVAVTRMYGSGMDFSGEDVELPHGGKSVRELTPEAEIAVNETFIDAFQVNYPLVFTGGEAAEAWHVSGIPTVFVIGRDGNVVGHVVGGGAHEALRALVATALAAPAKAKS